MRTSWARSDIAGHGAGRCPTAVSRPPRWPIASVVGPHRRTIAEGVGRGGDGATPHRGRSAGVVELRRRCLRRRRRRRRRRSDNARPWPRPRGRVRSDRSPRRRRRHDHRAAPRAAVASTGDRGTLGAIARRAGEAAALGCRPSVPLRALRALRARLRRPRARGTPRLARRSGPRRTRRLANRLRSARRDRLAGGRGVCRPTENRSDAEADADRHAHRKHGEREPREAVGVLPRHAP
jgi:hypothetical protein